MKKIIVALFVQVAMASCVKSSHSSEKATSPDSLAVTDTLISTEGSEDDYYLYAQMDSVFTINGKEFKVDVRQFDFTEKATGMGDSLSRPTYTCTLRITDVNKKIVFADSVLRDSWAYPGKIVSIDHYQLAFPQFSSEGNEIIFSFNVYEEDDGDAITGFIVFDINSFTHRYYWEESTSSL